MGRTGSFILILIVIATVSAQRQAPDGPTDPFSVGIGRSFSASGNVDRNQRTSSESTAEEIVLSVREAMTAIKNNYAGGPVPDGNEMIRTAIGRMLLVLDPHSNYFDPAEYTELLSDQRSEYFGIGATIANYSVSGRFDTYVTASVPDSPAFRKRLRFGDKIIEVDGKSMRDRSAYYVRNKVRGKIGSIVRLTIERPGVPEPFIVSLRRNRIPQPSIADAFMLGRSVGYIDLTNGFNFTTEREFSLAVRELKKQGMTSLVLDLRNNSGGILEQAVRVTENFLPSGNTIVSQKGRVSSDNRSWRSTNRLPLDIPLVLLVNKETASASEIVAGALQDYDRALIVGEKTFGKGLVQSVIDLPYGAGLTLTTAKYFTPAGRLIQRDYSGGMYEYFRNRNDRKGKIQTHRTVSGRIVRDGEGITPDVVVKLPATTEEEETLLDPVFHFSVRLGSGQVSGLENFHVFGQVDSARIIGRTDFDISERIFREFEKFVRSHPEFGVSEALILRKKNFIREKIRYNYVCAKYGSVTARQVLLQYDPQLTEAMGRLPRARQMITASAAPLRRTFKK